MVPNERTNWFRAFQRWRVLAITALFVLLGLLYLASGPPGERALAVFVLAPLIVGAFGVWQTTAWTTVAAVAATGLTWLWTSPLSGSAFVGRLAVVAIGGATTVLAAHERERMHRSATALRVVAEQSRAFVDQLVPQPTCLRCFDTTIHYEPGEAGLQVGGDFIDVQRISPDGTRAPIEAVSAAVRSVDWFDGRTGVEGLVASFRPPDGSFDDDVAILLIDPRSRTA